MSTRKMADVSPLMLDDIPTAEGLFDVRSCGCQLLAPYGDEIRLCPYHDGMQTGLDLAAEKGEK